MTMDPVFQYTALGAFALLFAFSALEKWNDQEVYASQLRSYRLVPEAMTQIVSQSILFAEFIAAILLISPAYFYGALLGLVLLALYTSAIAVNLVRGRTHIDCGCLGSRGEGISYHLVTRNIILMLALASVFVASPARDFGWLDYVSVLFAILCAALIYFTASELIKNHINARHWWG